MKFIDSIRVWAMAARGKFAGVAFAAFFVTATALSIWAADSANAQRKTARAGRTGSARAATGSSSTVKTRSAAKVRSATGSSGSATRSAAASRSARAVKNNRTFKVGAALRNGNTQQLTQPAVVANQCPLKTILLLDESGGTVKFSKVSGSTKTQCNQPPNSVLDKYDSYSPNIFTDKYGENRNIPLIKSAAFDCDASGGFVAGTARNQNGTTSPACVDVSKICPINVTVEKTSISSGGSTRTAYVSYTTSGEAEAEGECYPPNYAAPEQDKDFASDYISKTSAYIFKCKVNTYQKSNAAVSYANGRPMQECVPCPPHSNTNNQKDAMECTCDTAGAVMCSSRCVFLADGKNCDTAAPNEIIEDMGSGNTEASCNLIGKALVGNVCVDKCEQNTGLGLTGERDAVTSKCACSDKYGYKRVYENGACVIKCPGGNEVKTGDEVTSCSCGNSTDYNKVNQNCGGGTCSEEGKEFVGGSCIDKCGAGLKRASTTTECEKNCPPGSTPNANHGNSTWANNKASWCSCDTGGKKYTPSSDGMTPGDCNSANTVNCTVDSNAQNESGDTSCSTYECKTGFTKTGGATGQFSLSEYKSLSGNLNKMCIPEEQSCKPGYYWDATASATGNAGS